MDNDSTSSNDSQSSPSRRRQKSRSRDRLRDRTSVRRLSMDRRHAGGERRSYPHDRLNTSAPESSLDEDTLSETVSSSSRNSSLNPQVSHGQDTSQDRTRSNHTCSGGCSSRCQCTASDRITLDTGPSSYENTTENGRRTESLFEDSFSSLENPSSYRHRSSEGNESDVDDIFGDLHLEDLEETSRSSERTPSCSPDRMLDLVLRMKLPIFIRSSQTATVDPIESEIIVEHNTVLVSHGMSEEERREEMKHLFKVHAPKTTKLQSSEIDNSTTQNVFVGGKVIVVQTKTVIKRLASNEFNSTSSLCEINQICPSETIQRMLPEFLSINTGHCVSVENGVYNYKEIVKLFFGSEFERERGEVETSLVQDPVAKVKTNNKMFGFDERLRTKGYDLTITRNTTIACEHSTDVSIWQTSKNISAEETRNYDFGATLKDGNLCVTVTKVKHRESRLCRPRLVDSDQDLVTKHSTTNVQMEEEVVVDAEEVSVVAISSCAKKEKIIPTEHQVKSNDSLYTATATEKVASSLSTPFVKVEDVLLAAEKKRYDSLKSDKDSTKSSEKEEIFLETRPSSVLVFNSPFDVQHSYSMRITNRFSRPVAWCSKTNKISRIRLRPSFGKLLANESKMITVSCLPFKFNEEKMKNSRHRISFLVKEIGGENGLARQLFNTELETKRKNIAISYNV